MKRTDCRDFKVRSLLQDILHLNSVLSHNAEIIAAGFACPVLFDIEGAELAESVGREQDLVGAVVCHDDLGPMHHRGGDEIQGMLSKLKLAALAHLDAAG